MSGNWRLPTVPAEPVAGYDIYVSWTDSDGIAHTTGATFASVGSNSLPLQGLPDDASTYSITVVAVDASGNEGAYPTLATKVTRG
jgi:hypothetical protein